MDRAVTWNASCDLRLSNPAAVSNGLAATSTVPCGEELNGSNTTCGITQDEKESQIQRTRDVQVRYMTRAATMRRRRLGCYVDTCWTSLRWHGATSGDAAY